MFEKATRMKLRFNYRGLCFVEDLWDLHLKSLDEIYKELNAQNRVQKEESLLETRTKQNDLLDLQIAIVKHIVAVKLQEQKDRQDKVEKSERKQKILSIISEKQDADLRNLSVDDLTKLINEL